MQNIVLKEYHVTAFNPGQLSHQSENPAPAAEIVSKIQTL